MRYFTVHPHMCVRSLRSPWALAFAALLLLSPRASEAQLGRLKKMGADAMKDAAKEKLGVDKKDAAKGATGGAAPGSKEARLPTLDDEHIALVLASLAPQVKEAQIRADAALAATSYREKKKASDACVEQASKTINPMAIAANAEKNSARITALNKQTEAMQTRFNASLSSNDVRAQTYLQDSLTVLTMRQTALSMGLSCTFDFAPSAVLEAAILDRAGRSASDNGEFDPGEAARKSMSRYEYGLLRERVALWAMLQANPALKGLGKEGVFSSDEQAALAKHAAEIAKLAPLFKSDAMQWKGWSDLRDW